MKNHSPHRWVYFLMVAGLTMITTAGSTGFADGNMGIGALGRIEPRSRLIRVSHNAGPDGTRVHQLLFQEGDLVNQGEKIAILSDHAKKLAERDATNAYITILEAQLQAEKVTLAFNKREHARHRLLEQNAATSAALADAKRLAMEQSEIAIKRLTAEIANAGFKRETALAELDHTIIVAPITGTIVKIHTRPGERIKDNGLLEMADLTQLDIVAEVYESDMPRIRPGQQARITATGFERPYNAEIRELGFQVKKNDLNDTDPLADTDNRIVEVRLTLEPDAVNPLRHQIFRQVRVRIFP
ncbi:MAG: HlyD family efflux transporter periplasmic adaptor subunit [Nitrosomonas sp.]|nr:MAG: HlyD family efflux transporter periplasmic adaptor subunit [Nitrosomonas sp.]